MNNNNNNKLNNLKPQEGPVVTHTMVDMNLITHPKKYKHNLKQPVYMTDIPKPSLMKKAVDTIRRPISKTYHHDLPTVYNAYHHRHLSVRFGFGFGKQRPVAERNYINVVTPATLNERSDSLLDVKLVNENLEDENIEAIAEETLQVQLQEACYLVETAQDIELIDDNQNNDVTLDSPAPLPLNPLQKDLENGLKTDATRSLSLFESILKTGLKPVMVPPKTRVEAPDGNAFLLISLDGGDTWREPKVPPPKDVRISVVAIGNKVQVCAGRFDSLYHSFDGGDTWDKCKNQPQIRDWTSIVILGEEDERIEARTSGGDSYVSTDLGDNWTPFYTFGH
jgi:hypothetical protein